MGRSVTLGELNIPKKRSAKLPSCSKVAAGRHLNPDDVLDVLTACW